MKHFAQVLWLPLALILVCGCGGGARPSSLGPSQSSDPPSNPPPNPPQQATDITGNWQFSATSTALPGTPSATIAGNITQTEDVLSGTMHIDGWSCFEKLTTVSLAGTLTAESKFSLTSASIDGQVISLSGIVSKKGSGFPYSLKAIYSVSGGCADGDQGDVTGTDIDSIAGFWAASWTTAGGESIHVNYNLKQGNADSDGNFALTGTATFDDLCSNSGITTPGTVLSDSSILGRSVLLDVKTDNGTVNFLGTFEPYGLMEGTYTVTGGPCDSNGTAYLSPWEY